MLERHERRLRGEPVPSEYEMQLLLPDETTRTAGARVSLEGQEVVIQLQDLTGLAAGGGGWKGWRRSAWPSSASGPRRASTSGCARGWWRSS